MKILHTADWHLGKKLDRFSRLEEQTAVMDELLNLAEQQQVDLVLVAGDLFDSFYPSTAAIDLFYKSLKRLAKEGSRAVVAIAGNHDSPSLINAPNPLARECGIILIGQPKPRFHHSSSETSGLQNLNLGLSKFSSRNMTIPCGYFTRLMRMKFG